MAEIEQTLSSMEVAEMVAKKHADLMRDIRRYAEQLAESKIALGDFFIKSTYFDTNNQSRPCYKVTKKGCEFIAHKLTGTKGTAFTAKYINRFHEMQDIISKQENRPQLPWFIRNFGKEGYIMLFRDFKTLTGVEIFGNYTAWKRADKLQGGLDYNGWRWHTAVNREDFLKKYGFDYGDEDCLMYLYPRGIKRALEIYRRENGRKLNQEAYDMIAEGLKTIEPPNTDRRISVKKSESITIEGLPIHVNISIGNS
ncbi:MAG: Rha family transcriptional regulator [Lachnospiraceae bacterium]|nr:Rha family transcriptional regulator [Lachnospiraceae bacterium]MDE6980545.1 Rha family transcriptional regulator [Lachnospiraceae bacterium]